MDRLVEVRAVIFDWDDTKVQTYPALCRLYPAFASTLGLPPPTPETISNHMGVSLPNMLALFWPDVDRETIFKQFMEYSDVMQPCFEPFEDTLAVTTLLKEKYVLGVVSSGPRIGIERAIERHLKLPLDTYRFIHGADECKYHKPDPRVFDEAFDILKQDGITEEQSIYVGDNIKDYHAARGRGLRFVPVISGFTSREKFIAAGVPESLIIPGIRGLPTLLR